MIDQEHWIYRVRHPRGDIVELLSVEDIINSISPSSNEWNCVATGWQKNVEKQKLVERFVVIDSDASVADLNLLAIRMALEKAKDHAL